MTHTVFAIKIIQRAPFFEATDMNMCSDVIISVFRSTDKPLHIEAPNGQTHKEVHMYEVYAQLRDAKGVTDYAVAKATQIGVSTFSDWKRGRITPKLPKLK